MEQAQGILEGLDERQRTAATTLQGPVRIIAGAGAGKTRTVTRRIAYACATGAWKPERVLAVTFWVKAAAEMRARRRCSPAAYGSGPHRYIAFSARRTRAQKRVLCG